MGIPFLPPELVSVVLYYLDIDSLFMAQQLNSMWWNESQRVLQRELQQILADQELRVFYDFAKLAYWYAPGLLFGNCGKTKFIEFALPSRITQRSMVIWTKQRLIETVYQSIEPALHVEMSCIPQVEIRIEQVVNLMVGRSKKRFIRLNSPTSPCPQDAEGYFVRPREQVSPLETLLDDLGYWETLVICCVCLDNSLSPLYHDLCNNASDFSLHLTQLQITHC
jgi:hypothetical protein